MSKQAKRIDYTKGEFNIILDDPFDMLISWWDEALLADIPMSDAVFLSTISDNKMPDARIVLLKNFSKEGLIFYSNYESSKAKQIEANPNVCMVIFWPELEKQIRIRGTIKKTSRAASEQYFAQRPVGAQISAHASKQSSFISSRQELEKEVARVKAKFADKPIPCPEHWGGYMLTPNYFEYWQGRKNRLHDRIIYEMSDGQWVISRLAP